MIAAVLNWLASASPNPIAAQLKPRPRVTYYHGGVIGLRVGDLVLPPTQTNAVSVSDINDSPDQLRALVGQVHRRDRVYLTTSLDVAKVFAALYCLGSARRGGDVYEVEPIGDVEPDPDYLADDGASVCAEKARVICVVRHRVWRSTSLGIPT